MRFCTHTHAHTGIWKSRKWKWNGNWKRKLEMEIGNGNGDVAIAGARYSARHCVEMVLCAAMEEGTESSHCSTSLHRLRAEHYSFAKIHRFHHFR